MYSLYVKALYCEVSVRPLRALSRTYTKIVGGRVGEYEGKNGMARLGILRFVVYGRCNGPSVEFENYIGSTSWDLPKVDAEE